MSEFVKISGFSELEQAMQQFPIRVEKNIASGMVRAGAVVIQKEASQRAPVSEGPHLLGTGSRKVWIAPGSLKKGIKVRKAPVRMSKGMVTWWVYIRKSLWYWKFVEFGTQKMTARPFIRPAYESMKMAAIERMRQYAAARIEKEAGKR